MLDINEEMDLIFIGTIPGYACKDDIEYLLNKWMQEGKNDTDTKDNINVEKEVRDNTPSCVEYKLFRYKNGDNTWYLTSKALGIHGMSMCTEIFDEAAKKQQS